MTGPACHMMTAGSARTSSLFLSAQAGVQDRMGDASAPVGMDGKTPEQVFMTRKQGTDCIGEQTPAEAAGRERRRPSSTICLAREVLSTRQESSLRIVSESWIPMGSICGSWVISFTEIRYCSECPQLTSMDSQGPCRKTIYPIAHDSEVPIRINMI